METRGIARYGFTCAPAGRRVLRLTRQLMLCPPSLRQTVLRYRNFPLFLPVFYIRMHETLTDGY